MKTIERIKSLILINKLNVFHIFLISLLVRIAYLVLTYTPKSYQSLSDDLAYMNLAVNMVKHGLFILHTEELCLTAKIVGPGIGWLIFPVIYAFGENWLALFIYTAFISSFIPAFIYLLAKTIYTHRIAVFAAFWGIVYILFLKYTLTAGKDIWMTLLLLISIYISVKQINKTKYIFQVILLSFIVSLLIHLDERYIFFIPLFFIFLLLYGSKKRNIKLIKSFFFGFLVLVFMAPWLIRNYSIHKKIILISLRTAHYSDKILGYEKIEYFPSHDGRWYISPSQIDSIKNNSIKSYIEKKLLPQHVEAIKKGIVPHKFTNFETCFSSFINFWEPVDFCYSYYQTGYRFDGKWSLKHNLSSAFFYGIMLIFSIIGFYLLYKKQKIIIGYILSFILIYTLLHTFMIPFTTYRYRLPLDPYIIIAGSYGIIYTLKALLPQKN